MEKENKKTMHAFHAGTLRGIVEKINSEDMQLQKEDIVQIVPSVDGFVLLYYK